MSWPSTDFELEIQTELDTLRAENVRLRKALEQISQDERDHHRHPGTGPVAIARAALSESAVSPTGSTE